MGNTSGKETPVKKASRRKSSAGQAATTENSTVTIPISEFQNHAKEILTRRFVDIMETMAQKSAEGSMPHTKYLFEIGGVKEELQRLAENEGEPSLAEMLMAEVRRHREAEISSPAEPARRDETEAS